MSKLLDLEDVTAPACCAPLSESALSEAEETGLIEGERRGTWVYYRVVPERLTRLSGLFALPIPTSA